jgi:predicted O-linked N-acetylglucosamine transferase (SPINDLY family)
MRRSPLTDAQGFARGIEAAYRQMWEEYFDGCGDAKQ